MKKKTTLTKEEQIKILEESNKMLRKTEKEVIDKNGEDSDSIPLIRQAIEENYAQMIDIDPSLRDKINSLRHMKPVKNDIGDEKAIDFDFSQKNIGNDSKKEEKSEEIVNKVDSMMNSFKEKLESIEKSSDIDNGNSIFEEKINESTNNDYYFDVKRNDLSYDVIPLPSNGEVYPIKMPRLSVAYLTAESENLITSPHLYKDDLIVDALLKYHVLNKGINTDDLISGDVDAILLWLRATGYGTEYPIIVTDSESGKEFETVIDLNDIKIKDFKLKGDKNGWFEYQLPISKVNVKFKYLSRKEEKQLKRINDIENNEIKVSLISQEYNSLLNVLKIDDSIDNNLKNEIRTKLNEIKDLWFDGINNSNVKVNHLITNRLELSIMEVNGNTDKNYIRSFISKMPALDSLKLRRYIEDNRPGVDWEITVQRPKSLGGGSMTTFLRWGAESFLNI